MSQASAAGRPRYGIDAGGSATSVRTATGESWRLPSVNPTSVGQDASGECLARLFAQIRQHAGGTRAAIWLASASVAADTAAAEARRYAGVARATRLDAGLIISNDMTPLLLTTPPGTGHLVVVCGTGSAFLATGGWSPPVRAGGCEYLGSDEGSAFDLGLGGLRAAVRGLDGRGPATALSGLLARQAGLAVPEFARELAQAPFPKPVVAALAGAVLDAWQDGDEVAGRLAEAALGELATGMRAARDAAGLASGWALSALGGVLTGCPPFFGRLAQDAAGLGAGPVTLVSDPASAVLAALASAADDPLRCDDPRAAGATWNLDLTGAPRAAERAGR